MTNRKDIIATGLLAPRGSHGGAIFDLSFVGDAVELPEFSISNRTAVTTIDYVDLTAIDAWMIANFRVEWGAEIGKLARAIEQGDVESVVAHRAVMAFVGEEAA